MPSQTIHATSVSIDGKAVLILGPSGAGKSSLALQLMGMGAQLISDDQTVVTSNAEHLIASAPPTISGMIEARGVGLIHCMPASDTPICFVVDLNQTEPNRLPEPHTYTVLNVTVPCLWNVDAPHFAASILLYAKGGIGGMS